MSPQGLKQTEAVELLRRDGPNQLARAEAEPGWRRLLRQLESPMIWLLLAAAAVAAALSDVIDALAIGTIVLLNAAVGFFQESRAERAVLALRGLTAPRAKVLRDGEARLIPAAEVVRGDLLLLEEGDVVAADARLLEVNRLSTREAALTGESAAVEKQTAPVDAQAPLAERLNEVFAGTSVATGTGRAEVFATGMATQLGKIAHLLGTAESGPTPLQKRLQSVSRVLLLLCVAATAAVAGLGLARGEPWLSLLMSSISLAVAVVPEGLPAVVTIALSAGVQRMAARQVLVRRLPSVETLGATTVICTDKTGTLTTGEMAVREVWGDDPALVLETAAGCCDAELSMDGKGTGDPTELAILRAAAARGLTKAALERSRPRVSTFPFDTTRRRMSVFRSDGVSYVKGAIESLLPLCRAGTEGAAEAAGALAAKGLRVLAVARGTSAVESELTLVGLLGLADPPRPEAIEAIAQARRAGVRTVMMTGDHPATAHAIAREMGLVLPGEDFSERVFARATPEDKLNRVRALKAQGEVVAMTGDGVNDAPALREAHIGIAMGLTGTEVTREAADMVLANDDFASIVAAVREGRGIFDNIRKAVVYLLSGSAGKLLVMFGASVMGLPAPLLPLQLLWVNLVTDGFPALTLVMEPADPDVLERPPRRPDEPMLGRAQWLRILAVGLLEAAVTTSAYALTLPRWGELSARTFAFNTLVAAELLRAFAARSPDKLLWEVGAFSNLKLIAVVVVSAAAQLLLLEVPVVRSVFGLGTLPWAQTAFAVALGFIPVSVMETAKLIRRGCAPRPGAPAGGSGMTGLKRAAASPP